MKKPLKWAITVLGMVAVFGLVYLCGELFGVTAGPVPTIVLMLAVYVAGWFWTRAEARRGGARGRKTIRPGAAAQCGGSFFAFSLTQRRGILRLKRGRRGVRIK